MKHFLEIPDLSSGEIIAMMDRAPVTRGEEVSAESIRSPLCQNYAAKNYLLHSQNALMEFILE